MATIYTPAASADRSAPMMPAASHYCSAAELISAIRAAASLAPEFAPTVEFPERYRAGRYPEKEPAPFQSPTSWDESDGPACAYPRVDVRPECPGPFLPAPADARVTFAYAVGDARGSLTVANVRSALLALADKVHSNRAAYDGKAKRARLPGKPRSGSAAHVAARGLWADRDYAGAITMAQSVGAVFFGSNGTGAGHAYMNAERIELGGHSFTIGRAVQTGRFRVLHTASGLAVDCAKSGRPDDRGFTSYSAARDWIETATACEAFRAKLDAAAKSAPAMDQADVLAHYFSDDAQTVETDAPAAAEPVAEVSAPETAPSSPIVADAKRAAAIVERFYDDNLSGAPGCTVSIEAHESEAQHLRAKADSFESHAPQSAATYREAARILEKHAAAKRREMANPGPAWMTHAARRVYAVHMRTAEAARRIAPEFRGMMRRPRSAGFMAEFLAADVRAHRSAIAAAVRADRAAARDTLPTQSPSAPGPVPAACNADPVPAISALPPETVDVSPLACILSILDSLARQVDAPEPWDRGELAALDMYRRTCPADWAEAMRRINPPADPVPAESPAAANADPVPGDSQADPVPGERSCLAIYSDGSFPITRARAAYLLRAARSRGRASAPRRVALHSFAIDGVRLRIVTGQADPGALPTQTEMQQAPAPIIARQQMLTPALAATLDYSRWTDAKRRVHWAHAQACTIARRVRDAGIVPLDWSDEFGFSARPGSRSPGALALRSWVANQMRVERAVGRVARRGGVILPTQSQMAPADTPDPGLPDADPFEDFDESAPAPLDGLEVSELTDPDAYAEFEDEPAPAVKSGPPFRIPPFDPRIRIPARFTPAYVLRG